MLSAESEDATIRVVTIDTRPPVGSLARPRALILRLALVVVLACVSLVTSTGNLPRPVRILNTADPLAFNLLDWELHHLSQRIGRIAHALVTVPQAMADERQAVREFFVAPPAARAELRDAAEAAVERQLTDVLRNEGLAIGLLGGSQPVFPPVSFRFTSPPALLVISPRDRIAVVQSVFLVAGLTADQIESLETRAEREGVSALVTRIGGLATYPAMVIEAGRAGDVLAAVAHEWVHAYLAFQPLGRSYWSSQESRTINETVAEVAGRELGEQLAMISDLPGPIDRRGGDGDRRFRQEMRRTRLEAERLLASERISEAEEYMEHRRHELAGLGYRIRRLNQAYFAFHGSYADSAAGDQALAGLVREIRSSSDSLGSFLARVAGVQSIRELEVMAAGQPAHNSDVGRTQDSADTG